jgi:hypothetical protein
VVEDGLILVLASDHHELVPSARVPGLLDPDFAIVTP